jgi:hypothetical protein
MSGVRIDLDETRDQNSFVKPKITIQDEDSTAILSDVTNIAEKTIQPSAPKNQRDSGSSKVHIQDESFDVALSKQDEENVRSSGAKIEIKEESSARRPIESTRAAPPSSTRAISDAIRETIGSSIKNSHRSERAARMSEKPERSSRRREHPEDKPRLPKNEKNRPIDPNSARMKSAKEEEEKKAETEEEIDMMPKTDAEKHNYWKTRLQILKSKFPDVSIPKSCNDIGWGELRKIYYIEMDRVSITKNVEMYKMVMIILFFVLEYIGNNFLKVDVKGFAVHSMRSMYRYERLLIELGEKNYSSFADNWPIEIRLCGMVLVSAIIYCIAKYIFKLTGQDMSEDFFELFNNLGSATVEADLPPGVGMDTPGPGKEGDKAGGLMGMLSGLMGNLGGGGGGGLADILGGLMGGGNNAQAAPNKDAVKEPEVDAEGNRIKPPTYRKKKRKPKAQTE